MRFLLSIIVLSFSLQVSAKTALTWNKVEIEQSYSLTQSIQIQLPSSVMIINKGTKLSLIEVSDLPMLKVKFHKYQLERCANASTSSDLELINISQGNSDLKSVGVNLSLGCNLDVYIDIEDQKMFSFLN